MKVCIKSYNQRIRIECFIADEKKKADFILKVDALYC